MRNAGGTVPPSALPGISPARGEIGCCAAFANCRRRNKSATPKLPISPLAGEMSGRTEGGVKERGG
ncbi:MAG: propionyl-coenzyme A carboxylase alpha polypeptide [Mesorhizobium sp.]|nr:MAG: propionyl-coenzyme A carboxylase alpha polypeptide [Mesorhizobium sp.]